MPRIQFALGVSPENASYFDDEAAETIRKAAALKNVVAIGSCGLGSNPDGVQEIAFERQIGLAHELCMPIIVEAGDALERTWEMLQSRGLPERGVMLRLPDVASDQLAAWIEAGCYFTFGPKAVQDPAFFCKLAKSLPADRILVESGAPEMDVPQLSGMPPRCDQSVFVADVIQGICPTPQIVANTERFFA